MTVRCPRCNRFMMEIDGYGRAVCRDCGVEVTVSIKGQQGAA